MTDQGHKSSRAEHSITEPFTLGDLRWLVAACTSLPDNAAVRVIGRKTYSNLDWDEPSITVSGDMPTNTIDPRRD